MKALIIRQPHLAKILSGQKTWELRTTSTKTRGRIALIEAGSGMITGECDLVSVEKTPVSPVMRKTTYLRHGLKEEDHHLMDKWKYAWVLINVLKYEKPLPYQHPQGAVIWVNLKP